MSLEYLGVTLTAKELHSLFTEDQHQLLKAFMNSDCWLYRTDEGELRICDQNDESYWRGEDDIHRLPDGSFIGASVKLFWDNDDDDDGKWFIDDDGIVRERSATTKKEKAS